MVLIAGILLEEGFKHVDEVRKALFAGAFLLGVTGFAEGVWLAGEDMRAQLLNFLKIGIIGSLIFSFPIIIQEGDKALGQIHTSIQQGQQDAFRAQIDADVAEPSWTDIPSRIAYTLGICLQKIGWIGYKIVYWVKDISILLLIAVSPLLIGFLAFSHTKSLGINFLITSLTVILWNIGFAIVDTLLVVLGNIVMPIMGTGAAGVGSAFVVTVGPQFVAISLVAAILPIAMYCAVPIITGAIMRGSNVAGAAMSAYGMAHQGFSHTGAAAGVGRLAEGIRGSINSNSGSLASLGSSRGLGGHEFSSGGGSSFGGSGFRPSSGSHGPFMSGEDGTEVTSRKTMSYSGIANASGAQHPAASSVSSFGGGSSAEVGIRTQSSDSSRIGEITSSTKIGSSTSLADIAQPTVSGVSSTGESTLTHSSEVASSSGFISSLGTSLENTVPSFSNSNGTPSVASSGNARMIASHSSHPLPGNVAHHPDIPWDFSKNPTSPFME